METLELILVNRLPYIVVLLGVFVIGTVVGSLLNVCILRLPSERSILWPGSHCFACLRPVDQRDNIPVLGYFRTRGRCRHCGATFTIRYSLIELFTGLLFAGLFYVEVMMVWHDIPLLKNPNIYQRLLYPWQAWVMWMFHATFLSFLIVASFCDLDHRIIPLSVTIPGTLIGLIGSTLFPWPWPQAPAEVMTALATATNPDMPPGWWALPRSIPAGAYLWPVWGPLPDWLPPGHWLTGLATGLAGAAMGTFMLRGARALFSKALGREALGLGDADLMMMAGAFLGWQPIVVAFFVGAFAALVLMVPLSLMRGEGALPFGPGLALGLVITWLAWPSIGPSLQPIFFDALTLGVLLVFVVPVAFLLAFVMGRLRGQPVEDDHVPVGS